tara:strand:- start:783 stop:2168 length:1386 start_codon:yes stop_codon:yes gene_type:complete
MNLNTARLPLTLLAVVETAIAYFAVAGTSTLVVPSGQVVAAAHSLVSLEAGIVAVVLFATQLSMGLYHFHQRLYFREILVRVFVAIVLAIVVLAVLFFLRPSIALPNDVAIIAVLVAFMAILVVRFYFFRHFDTSIFRRRTLIFGTGDGIATVSDLRRRSDRRGFVVVGTVDAAEHMKSIAENGQASAKDRLTKLAKSYAADEIVVALEDRRGSLPFRELLDCVFHDINVIELPDFLERESGKIRTDLINPSSLIFSPGFRTSTARRYFKRAFDLVICSAILLVAWPLMLCVAIAILIEDGFRAPVIYRQVRVGYKGADFSIFKFRSMSVDAESGTGAVWAQENDSRVTRVGKFIRKARLDELPQLINVLRGDMSFVGPRPERPEFVKKLAKEIPYYIERHMVKPGITGWAQLRYPYGSSDEDALQKLQFDLYYIKNQSVTLDAVLMLQTLEVVLFGKGSR